MKKILLFSLLFVPSMNAQVREKNDFEIAPTIGYGLSAFYGTEDNYIPKEYKESSNLSSINFGVGVDIYFSNRISLRSGIYFIRMGTEGFQYENPFNGRGTYVSQKINYVTVPAHFNYHFGVQRNWNFYLGPSFGILGKATNNDIDIKYYVNEYQVGAGYGVGYKYILTDRIGIGVNLDNFIGLTYVPKM